MFTFYFIALIPSIIGAILFMCHKKVVWQEWLGGTAIAFLTSAILHVCAIYNMTADQETWSGTISYACHFPRWVEEYEVAIYKTETYYTGSGKDRQMHTRRVFSHYETRHDTHPEHWVIYLDFGTIQEERGVSESLFKEINENFGGVIIDGGKQPYHHGGSFDGGDNNIYKTKNITGYIYPVTTIKNFENRIKAAPSLFSFAKVPTNCPVYEWPENPNCMVSDRILGVTTIDQREWDLLNSRLGHRKKVNLILIGFQSADSMLGQWQEAKFIGGKKNDLVMCIGLNTTNVIWSYVFGWTEKELCKRNLETILLDNPINNDILSLIEKEVVANYEAKDWDKFDYISVEPPLWSYIVLIVVMFVTQAGFWFWANANEFNKVELSRNYSSRRYYQK